MGLTQSMSRFSGYVQGYSTLSGLDDEANDMEMGWDGQKGPPFYDDTNLPPPSDYFSGDHGSQDSMLHQIYNYWRGKGLQCILAERILHILRCAFAIGFSSVFFVMINWGELLSCDGSACEGVPLLKKEVTWEGLSTAQKCLLVMEFFFSTALAAYLVKLPLFDWNRLRRTKEFYELHLGIPEKDVYFGVCDWGTVAHRLKKWQEMSPHNRINAFARDVVLDELAMAQCLMREQNILISLLNSRVLKLQLNTTTAHVLELFIIGGLLGWGHNKEVNRQATQRHNITRKWRGLTIGLGVLLLLFAPLLITWRVFYTVFKYGMVIKTEPGRLATRSWSVDALWKFREFNELPHVFEMRMSNSRKVAQEYVDQYPSHVETIMASTFAFVATGIIGFIIVLSVINEDALVGISVAKKPLLWWLSVLSAGIVVASQIRKEDDSDRGVIFDPVIGFEAISNSTHWRPQGYKDPQKHVSIYKKFQTQLFPWTLRHLLNEGLFVVTTPLHLIFRVAPNMDKIVEFLSECTVTVQGVGDIVCFSTFNFELYSGEGAYGAAKTVHSARVARFCREGKMEKSFLNFHTMHREYRVPATAQGVLERIKGSRYCVAPQAYPAPYMPTIYTGETPETSYCRPGRREHTAPPLANDDKTLVPQLERMTQLYNACEEFHESVYGGK